MHLINLQYCFPTTLTHMNKIYDTVITRTRSFDYSLV